MADENADKPKPKLQPDQELEDQAQKAGAYPLHDIVSRVTHRFGALNIIRNAANERTVELDKATGGS